MDALVAIANDAANAVDANDDAAFVGSLRRTARALARLGEAAGVGIVPNGFDELEAIAAHEESSFSVSGAGGGDIAVFIGPAEPSAHFAERARAHDLFSIDLTLDDRGVRMAPSAATVASSEHLRHFHTMAPQ
jgi:phosphomevalonate kinase